MKDRILRMLKKAGQKEYAKNWRRGTDNYSGEMFVMSCNGAELWLYWAGMKIRLIIMTDRLQAYVNYKLIAEEQGA